MKHLLIALSAILFFGCNQSKIEGLIIRVENLKRDSIQLGIVNTKLDSLQKHLKQLDSLQDVENLCEIGNNCVSIASIVRQGYSAANIVSQVRNALPTLQKQSTKDIYDRTISFLEAYEQSASVPYMDAMRKGLWLEIFKFKAKYIKDHLCKNQ